MSEQPLAIQPSEPMALVSKPSIHLPSVPSIAEIEAIKEICKVAAYSNFVSTNAPMSNMTQRTADAFFVAMYGRELGIPIMTSLRTIYVIDGKPACSGQALLSLVKRGGVQVELPDPADITTRATVRIKRPESASFSQYSYTEEMAEAAGLSGKSNWKKHKREMLMWRAVSLAVRFEAPDIAGGLYTIEELSPDTPVDEMGIPVSSIVVAQDMAGTPDFVAQTQPEPTPSEPTPTPAPMQTTPLQVGDRPGANARPIRQGDLVQMDDSKAQSPTAVREREAAQAVENTPKATEDANIEFDMGLAGSVEPPVDPDPLMPGSPTVEQTDAAFDAVRTGETEQPELGLVEPPKHPRSARTWDLGKVKTYTIQERKYINVKGATPHFDALITKLEASLRITDTSTTEEVCRAIDAHYSEKEPKAS